MASESFEWLTVARSLTSEAGVLVRSALQMAKSSVQETKTSNVDLVTEFDKKAESIIIAGIQKRYPDHAIISEESFPSGELKHVTWVIDPIDGTTNFIAGLPEVAVCIGILVDGKQEAGVVYNPIRDECFHAVRGWGAFLNDRPIHVNDGVTMQEALIDIEFGYVRTAEGADTMLGPVKKLLTYPVRGLRQIGSGALDLCFVACGRIDAVYAGVAGEGWKPWDYAAAGLIALEAGAKMCKVDGTEFDLFGDSVVCSTPSILEELLDCIKPQ